MASVTESISVAETLSLSLGGDPIYIAAWEFPTPSESLSFGRNTTVVLRQSLQIRQGQTGATSAVLSGIATTLPPISFTRAPDGWLYMANGLMPMIRWNGLKYASVTAGVPAPVNAPVASVGAFLGNSIDPESPKGPSGTYQIYQRFIDENDNPSNLSPVSNTLTVGATVQDTHSSYKINITNLDSPTDPKITRRQILRNTDGQFLAFYVEVDTTDLSSASFTLTMDDNTLGGQIAVPLFDEKGLPLANRFGIPPNNKPILATFLGRLFAGGDVAYGDGHLELVNNSNKVQGIGTNWNTALVGRLLYVTGQPGPYSITAVDSINQVLTLANGYGGPTNYFGLYTIHSVPADRNTVYFTEAGFYDAWPPTNAVQLDENGDTVTALIPAYSFLFIVQRRHIFRLTYLVGPTQDGGVFLSTNRGCVNNRCWVRVDDDTYLMDEEGIYRFSGGAADPISQNIQDLFWTEQRSDTDPRINWNAQDYFHAQLHKEETTVRWYVALSGDFLPYHALCFNYRTDQWWIEEYPFPVGASCVTDTQIPKVYLCGPAKRVYQQGVDTLDGPPAASGTTRGTISSATLTTLTDGIAAYPHDIIGYPVSIVSGRGKDQLRQIAAVSGTTIEVSEPWGIGLDATSVYQIGGIPWSWRGGWYRWAEEELTNRRRLEILFQPAVSPVTMDVQIFINHSETPYVWTERTPFTPMETTGVSQAAGSPDSVVDLTMNQGYAHIRMDSHYIQYVQVPSNVSVEMRGFSAETQIRLYQLTIEGAA